MIIQLPRFLSHCQVALVLIIILAFFPVAVGAQNPRGALRGIVQDSSGGRVVSAKVAVQAMEFFSECEAVADSGGEFRVEDLLFGVYRVTV